jgi:hypothetical protein
MKSPISELRYWYAQLEQRTLDTMPAEERAEVLAFDRYTKQHRSRICVALVLGWIAAAILLKITASSLGWIEALVVSFLLLGVLGWAMLSAWFGHAKFRLSMKLLGLVIVLAAAGAIAGNLFGRWLRTGDLDLVALLVESQVGAQAVIGGAIGGGVYALMIALVVSARRRYLQTRNAELQRQADAERTARQLADARLKLMQAQVEPHFLFNTLASVQQLAEHKAPDAAKLTAELIAFLRAGLSGLRTEGTTLGREFDMAGSYLAIMQTRMGSRLRFRLDLPESLRDATVPPAMLISLVENAIKHGVEPAADGGEIAIEASREGANLMICVTDSGLGLETSSGAQPMYAARGATTQTSAVGGVGLSNIRERLAAIYGGAASLVVEENAPRGTRATIIFPDSKST